MTINKITKSPTPTELIKKVNELVEGVNTGGSRTSSIPIGHVYTIGYSELDAGQLPLLGGEYSRTTYADLWAWVQSKPSLLKTESEWQTLKTASGDKGVPYYSTGNGTTTFRVPMFGCYIKGANSMGTVGDFLKAGLPTFSGSLQNVFTDGGLGTGCFSYVTTGTSILNAGTSKQLGSFAINPSTSSTIYGNSTTVTPDSIIQLYVVQAFGEVTNVGSTDVAAIAVGLQELETRTNVLETETKIIDSWHDTNGNFYRQWSDGFIEQGGRLLTDAETTVNLFIPFSNANYITIGQSVRTIITFYAITFAAKTPTSFKLSASIHSGATAAALSGNNWYTCGY